jgi:CDP-6-deoxy-D-xylo-4-hexulose-3-dehydrase
MTDSTHQDTLAGKRRYHEVAFGQRAFVPAEMPVPVPGRVLDACDLVHLVDASRGLRLTTGKYADQFEREFTDWRGVRDALLCNSGSSAGLLALSALTSHTLDDRHLLPGDEVISVAAALSTTVNPIVQNNLTQVFVDIELSKYDIDRSGPQEAIGTFVFQQRR